MIEDLLSWAPDEVIINGDVVNRGPYSEQALALIRTHLPQARCLRGNHEDFVLSTLAHIPLPDHTDYELRQMAHWTAQRLSPESIDWIRAWDDALDLRQPDGGAIHITHASRHDNRAGLFSQLSDTQLLERIHPAPSLFITAHTHKSGVRRVAESLIVNPGSVGTPLEGDTRASYARLSWREGRWQVSFRRRDYDRQRLLNDLEQSGFISGCGPTARLVAREFHEARSHVGPWMRQYHPRIERQEISVSDAVDAYLADTTAPAH